MNITISLAQFQVRFAQPDKNVSFAEEMTAAAASRGSNLLLLPELWTSGYDLENAERYAEFNRGLLPHISQLANQYNLAIGGSYLLGDQGGFFNTFALFLPGVSEPILYRKIHLFRKMDENKFLQPGQKVVTAQASWGETGLAVCYDLRFPELFRAIALRGSALACIVAEWPMSRVEHWRVLLRARAIENQMFVAAVNATGQSGPEVFAGRSAVLTPWGDTLVEGGSEEDLLTATMDLDLAQQIREDIPILQYRRPDVY
jgi:predicted amidohydrolase